MFLGSSKSRAAAARRQRLTAGLVAAGVGLLAFSYIEYQAKEAQAKQAELEAAVARTDANAATTAGQKQEALGRAIAAESIAKQLRAELATTNALAKDTVAKAAASGKPVPLDAQQIAAQAAMMPSSFDFLDFTNPLVLGGIALLGVGGWWFLRKKKSRR